jgi:hypothetical protein
MSLDPMDEDEESGLVNLFLWTSIRLSERVHDITRLCVRGLERERVAKPRRWYAFLNPVVAKGRRKLNGKGRCIHGKDVWLPFCTIFQECMEEEAIQRS